MRRYENNLKGYEEILKMRPCLIVLEPTGVYSTRPSQYFKEKGVKVLQVSPNVLSREKEFRGKKTDFYDAEKLENMVDKAKEYKYNPLRELVTLFPAQEVRKHLTVPNFPLQAIPRDVENELDKEGFEE
ncbi:hypothetical protein J5U21_01529 [Saccharolobus shibatae]|uniref:Transposase n=1 Tax=Saccharolobus shibatae TaxID=2286 RepID=A0A8F5BUS2_9CREN|nr:hypothetical protein J5U21_01529 [Saccharolobus shibatae]